MIKDLLDEKSSVSSVRVVMFLGVMFSVLLSFVVLAMNKDPNAWMPLISMFFLGGTSAKVVQKFGEKSEP